MKKCNFSVVGLFCALLFAFSVINTKAQVYPPDQQFTYTAQPSLSKPGYLSTVTDPILGSLITRIGNIGSMGGGQPYHVYAKQQPWNSDGSLIMLQGWPSSILNGSTYAVNKTIMPPGGYCTWANTQPNIIYGSDNNNTFVKIDVNTGVKSVVHTFSEYSSVDYGLWEGNMSNDDRYVALFCTGGSGPAIICYDLVSDVVVSTMSAPKTPNNCTMSQSGNYVMVQWNVNGSGNGFGIGVYNRSNMAYVHNCSSNGVGHYDYGKDTQGNDVCVGSADGSAAITMTRLDNGTVTTLIDASKMGWPLHISCRNLNRPGWAYISDFSASYEEATKANYQKMFAVKLDPTATGNAVTETFAFMHHQVQNEIYDHSAFGVPNRNGSVAMFRSDWADANGEVDSYVASMPQNTADVTPPSVPTNLISSAITQTSFTLSWTASTDNVGVSFYEVYKDGVYVAGTSNTLLSITGLACNTTYSMKVWAYDSAGNHSNFSTPISVTTSACTVCTLPGGWSGADIGGVTGQSSCESAGTYTIVAGGADIWDVADAFRYTYQTLNGDGTIIAKVNSIQNTDPWAKSGVMIRESLAANSAHVDCHITAGNGCSFQWRSTTGGITSSNLVAGIAASYWVKLQRVGNVFTAYYSADGTNWTQNGTAQTVTMASALYIGLAATSHLAGTLGTSVISNVTITTPDVTPPSVPTNLISSAITQTSFTLSWAASTDNVGVSFYEVFNNGVYVAGTTSTSMSITGLTCNTAYSMQVWAYDAAGNHSAQSTALIVTTSACTAANLIINPGIESALTSGWTGGSGPWINASRSSTYKNTGSYSLKVSPAGGGRYQDVTSGFTIGSTYTLSAYCRFSGTSSVLGYISVQTLNSSGTLLTNYYASTTSTTFTQIYKTFTVDANTAVLRVNIWYDGGTPSFYCDDFKLLPGTLKSAKIPGLSGSEASDISVYPNPVSSILKINKIPADASITIYSLDGRVISNLKANKSSMDIDVNNWNKGIYILSVKTDNMSVTKKIVVE